MDYKQAGVDIAAGDALVERIKPLAKATHGPEVLTGLGGFGALFALDSIAGMRAPVLVSGTDGVGTKVKLAAELGRHDSVGIDLVAMVVNDIVTTAAMPLFFLDYFASGKLDVDVGEAVVRGIAEGCKRAECALIGGETAEMPGVYAGADYDLAGFAVGIVERDEIIDGSAVGEGAALIGVSSSGIHSNGYSLVRRVFAKDARTHADALMTPTKIYVKTVKKLLAASIDLQSIAHITGGGIVGNVPRVLPGGLEAVIHKSSWERPQIFDEIASRGKIEETEMFRTFNMGLGLVLAIPSAQTDQALAAIDEPAWRIGSVQKGEAGIRLE